MPLILLMFGGKPGIRTLGTLLTFAGFQDRCIQPLCQFPGCCWRSQSKALQLGTLDKNSRTCYSQQFSILLVNRCALASMQLGKLGLSRSQESLSVSRLQISLLYKLSHRLNFSS